MFGTEKYAAQQMFHVIIDNRSRFRRGSSNLVRGEKLSRWKVAFRDFREHFPANIFIPTVATSSL